MNYLVMQKDELEVLRKRARRGWVALVVGMLLCVCAAFNVGRYRGHRDAADRLEHLQLQQTMQTHHLENIWTEQRAEREMLKQAGEAIKMRDGLVRYNEENWCPLRPKSDAKAVAAKK